MYFRVTLKMKKPTSFCCFTWIALIELNSTVEFLFIRETWDDRFPGKVGWWEILRTEGERILVMGGWILKWGALISLYLFMLALKWSLIICEIWCWKLWITLFCIFRIFGSSFPKSPCYPITCKTQRTRSYEIL